MRFATRLALGLVPLLAAACAADGGNGGGPETVATVTVSPSTASIEVGATQQFTATARNADGDVLSGRTFTWTSSETANATVSSNGVATGVGAGPSTIRATTGGVTGTAQLTVTAPGPASVTIAPDSADVAEGQTVQLAATVRDGDGNIISASVSWSSGNTGTATVDGTGLVTGVSQGTTQITATAGGVSAMATIVVTTPGNVTVTSITPSPMVEGQSATIRGEGFSVSAAQNNVTINGFLAPVTAASDTMLTIDVPEECFPAGDVAVAISTPTGSSGAIPHPMQPAVAPLSMGVGEFLLIQDPANFCLQFSDQLLNEEYVFGVQSVAENPNQQIFPRVRGQIPVGSTGSTIRALSTNPPRLASTASQVLVDDRLTGHWRAEAALRRRERAWLEEKVLGRPHAGVAASAVASKIPNNLAVGDTVPLKVPDLDAADFCAQFIAVDAVVRAVGARGVWLEDITNSAGGLSTAQFMQLSDFYDSQVHDVNEAWFGAFTDLDNNGKVAVLITHEVNDLNSPPLGFVSSTDLFPEFCASSNNGEIYYSRAVTSGYPVSALLTDAPTLLAHELTHVIQFGRRKAATNPFSPQNVWEAESQASFAEEVNGFVDTGRTSGQNYGASVAFGSDGSFGAEWFLSNIARLALYQGFNPGNTSVSVPGAPEECSWAITGFSDPPAGPCADGVNVRYMMWVFYRWLSDNIAVSQAEAQAFQRALIDNNVSGFANIEDVTGRSMDDLLGPWAASLYADDRAVTLDPQVSLPTWNLRDIFDAAVPSAQLTPRQVAFNAFSSDVTVRGGSSAYYVVSGLNRPATSVRARAQSGAPLPASSQLWIVRLQ